MLIFFVVGPNRRAVQLLTRYYQGELHEADTEDVEDSVENGSDSENEDEEHDPNSTTSTALQPKAKLPPLLVPLADKRPERLHWLGVSFGISPQLFNFWVRGQFRPVYLRQTPSPTTGEHTTVMIKTLECRDLVVAPQQGWLDDFVADFQGEPLLYRKIITVPTSV